MIKKFTNTQLLILCALIPFIESFINFYVFKSRFNSIKLPSNILLIIVAIVAIGQFIVFILMYSLIPYILVYMCNFIIKKNTVNVEIVKKCFYQSFLVSSISLFVGIVLIYMDITININFYRLVYMNIMALVVNGTFFVLLKHYKIIKSKAILLSGAMLIIQIIQNFIIIWGGII